MDFLSGTLPSSVTFSRGTQATMYGVDGTLQYAPNNVLLQSQTFDNASWTKSATFIQTNLLTYSEQFNNATWLKTALNAFGSGSVANTTATTDPLGGNTADFIQENTTPASEHRVLTSNITVANATQYTATVYAKQAPGARSLLIYQLTGTAGWSAYVDLANGTLLSSAAIGAGVGSAAVTSIGNGWYRASVTFTSTTTTLVVSVGLASGTNGVYTGDGTSGAYIWGAQLVQGSVPGNYQATTSAALPVLYTAPDGTLTALKACQDTAGGSHTVGQAVSVTAPPAKYSFSVYAKAGEVTSFSMQQVITTSYGATFNLVTQVTSGLIGSGTTATIVDAGNGWFRCTLNYITTAVISQNNAIYVLSGTGDGSSGFYIWGAQTTISSPGAAYVPTTTAVYYGPRFDYDPSGFAQQNLVLYSEQFDNAAWSKTGMLAFGSGSVVNATTAPDGTTTADLLTPNTSSSTKAIRLIVTGAGANTWSFYAKANGYTKVGVWDYATSGAYAAFLLSGSGSVLDSGVGASNATITSVGNGWYRCSFTATVTGLLGFSLQVLSPSYTTGSLNTAYAANGTDGIYFWGAQLNAGATALPYLATTSATVFVPTYVQQNLLTYSQVFENAIWGVNDSTHVIAANSAVAPDGTMTADIWTFPVSTGAFGYNAQVIAGAANQALTFSIWARIQSGTKNIGLRISNITIQTIGPADITLTTAWQRISYSMPAGSLGNTNQVGVGFVLASSNSVTAGTLIELWGAQLNVGATALPYYATTSAAYTQCAPRGLLIEEPRTNQLLQSNDFQTSWTPTNITRTLASITGPDGISSGVKIEATTTAAATLWQGSAIASTAATFSVYVKQGTNATTANSFVLRNNTTVTNLIVGTLNYSTGAWTYSTGSTGVIVTNVSNGWWRISLSAITGITSGDTIVGYVGFSGNPQTAGDYLYAYGAQLEAGGFATSYIFTTTAAINRNADVASVNTLTPWYNATEGTLVVQAYNFVPDADTIVRMIAVLADTAAYANAIRLERTVGNWRDVQTVAGVAVAVGGSWLVGVPGKLAGAYKANDSAGTFNGATPTSIGTSTVPIGVTYLGIGCSGGTSNVWDGWIQSIKYYPFRVPNATLQSITT